ncbi:MAG: NAD(P)/FAD-dependent oxidoreductase [Parvularculaceae bacterium]
MPKLSAESPGGEKRAHVVIVGAGFGGLEAAKSLAGSEVDVTLVDKRNYHLFQPLLYQVATAALTPAEIASPIRHVVRDAKNIRVFMDSVESVDAQARVVLTESGKRLAYDYLILATGARHSYFGRDDWAAFAPGLKTIDDAFALRQRILTAFEKAEMETDPERRDAWLTFVIVGAGPTGVELAGAIAELARHSLVYDFHHIEPDSARIILADAGQRVLSAFDPRLSARAQKHLEDLGVEVVLNARVERVDDGGAVMGERSEAARTIIWAAGVEASPAGEWLGAETDRIGRIIVNSDLSAPGHENVFAIGDTAAFTPEDAARSLPGVAPVAKQMGRYVARRILAARRGKCIGAFRYRDYGTMATIGRNKAIADLNGWRFSGFPGWFLWSFAHIYYLVGFRSRFVVGLNWFWSYLTWQRGVRLITGREGAGEDASNADRQRAA